MPESTPRHDARARWAAIGAAIAVAVGAGGIGISHAGIGSNERPVLISITPCRLMDTRPAPETVGPRATPLEANDTHTIAVHGDNGNCSIPTDAVAVVMNVAAVFPTGSSFLTVFPAGVERPLSANLNWTAGQPPVSNAVTADIGAGGQISFYNLTGQVQLTADVVGYYVDHHHDDRYALFGHTHDDRYSQLGHTHDERYTKRQQTITYGPLALVPVGSIADPPTLVPLLGNCVRLSTIDGIAYLPLQLPVGAQLQHVRVRAWDSNFNQTYVLQLTRMTASVSGNASSLLASTSGSGGFNIVRSHTLTPPGLETVDAGESFHVAFTPGDNTNGLCGVEVDVLLP